MPAANVWDFSPLPPEDFPKGEAGEAEYWAENKKRQRILAISAIVGTAVSVWLLVR